MILYIAGRKIELSEKTKVAQTKQANDLISLNTRQTNYTNRFKIPLTSSNKKAMAFLGIVGMRLIYILNLESVLFTTVLLL
jgi:hypothetical protein